VLRTEDAWNFGISVLKLESFLENILVCMRLRFPREGGFLVLKPGKFWAALDKLVHIPPAILASLPLLQQAE
jgi:hypothetical protein